MQHLPSPWHWNRIPSRYTFMFDIALLHFTRRAAVINDPKEAVLVPRLHPRSFRGE